MKIIVTGAGGFIGKYILKRFEDSEHEVCAFDLFPIETKNEVVEGDILNLDNVLSVTKGADVVIHMIGLPDARVAQTEPMKSFDLNLKALSNVLEACRVNKVGKLVFPSTAAVYGVTETVPVNESTALNPPNVYAYHKAICEDMIKVYNKNFGLNYVILRLFNVLGVGNKGVVKIFLDKAKAGEKLELSGAEQLRDFVSANDVADAFFNAAVLEKANNQTINLGSGEGLSIKDIVELIKEMYPALEFTLKESTIGLYDSVSDTTLAKEVLDLNPAHGREGIKKIIEEIDRNG